MPSSPPVLCKECYIWQWGHRNIREYPLPFLSICPPVCALPLQYTHTRIIFLSCCFYKQQYRFHPGVVQPMIFLASVLSSYQGSDTLSCTAEGQEGALLAGDVLPSIDTQAVRGKRRRNALFRNRGEWMGLQGLKEALWYTNKKIHHLSWQNLVLWRKTSISFLVSHDVSVPHNIYLAAEARILIGRSWVLNFLNSVEFFWHQGAGLQTPSARANW